MSDAAPNTQVATLNPKVKEVRALLERSAPAFAEVIPKHLTVDRLLRITVACVAKTPALLDCSQQSLLQAVMQCAELGLEPGSVLGEIYLVPFKGKVTAIPGYRGLVTLARRSGYVQDIAAYAVFKGDVFEYSLGTSPGIVHRPAIGAERSEKTLVCVYAVARLKETDTPHIEVMSKAQVDAIRHASPGGTMDAWSNHYVEQARKTVSRRICKQVPMSAELARGIQMSDEAEHSFDSSPSNIIDIQAAAPKSLRGKVAKAAAAARGPEVDADGQATGDAEPGER